ncbi:hypothetical protein C5167_033486 [Papaver somniferum]|uniref:Uncharacterized protein n=1 Tax=Papaver somniferum TaxID=3469 RepID=A0A4Y7KBW2_PAPSO|nr:hypothetical protein C5167_033486 [Papaver somniferum]
MLSAGLIDLIWGFVGTAEGVIRHRRWSDGGVELRSKLTEVTGLTLDDSAVLDEEYWWQVIDFARLNHSTISFFNIPETPISRLDIVCICTMKSGLMEMQDIHSSIERLTLANACIAICTRKEKSQHSQTSLLLKNLSQADRLQMRRLQFNTCKNQWSTVVSLEDFHGQHLTEDYMA